MIRSIVERWARGRCFRKRLPAAFGCRVIYASPDSALTYLLPRWGAGSRQLLSAARRFVPSGANVWDIGANVGVFAFAAADRAGPGAEVLALEPDPFLASLLQRSALDTTNADIAVKVVCAAASDTIGIARFVIAARGRSSNALELSGQRTQAGGARYVQHTPTITLDSLLDSFKAPSFIKIDVEGAEAVVLNGSGKILAECRPTFYVEVGGRQRQAVTEIFKRYRYRLYDGDSQDNRECDTCEWNWPALEILIQAI
jgi:FkbM family methyltransferase